MRLLAALALSLLAACSSGMRRDVSGRVVDASGAAVPDARVSLIWIAGTQTLDCDRDGRFEGTLALPSNLPALLATDNEWEQGAIVPISDAPQTVVLRPLATVAGTLDLSGINAHARSVRMYVELLATSPTRALVAASPSRDDALNFRLPPGKYELVALGLFEPFTHAFTVPEGSAAVELGRLAPKPARAHELYGEEAPELVAVEAGGVPKDGALASLRGKWVLLHFFNHRMKYNDSLGRDLRRFYEEHQDQRDRFEVVAVHHSDDVLSLRDLRAEHVVLPFPVVIDDEGKTFDAYGIARGRMRRAPREVLVNPDGRVEFAWQPGAALKRLAEKLGTEAR